VVTFSAILIWLVGLLGIILAGLLVTPVELRAYLRTSPRSVYRVDAKFFAGLSPSMTIFDSSRRKRSIAKRPKKKRDRNRRKSQVFGRADIVSAFTRLISGLIGAIHFRHLNLGQFYGYLMPLQYGGWLAQGLSISVRPNFERVCFFGEVDASVRVTAVSLMLPFIQFAWYAYGPRR
jgi:hypothetical protein